MVADSLQAFYTEVQTRLFAVCDLEAHFSHCYLNTLCKREIWRWEFQSTAIISLPHHHLYSLVLNGTLCFGLVLCSLQRLTSAIQSRPQVYHNQICSISYILAGRFLGALSVTQISATESSLILLPLWNFLLLHYFPLSSHGYRHPIFPSRVPTDLVVFMSCVSRLDKLLIFQLICSFYHRCSCILN